MTLTPLNAEKADAPPVPPARAWSVVGVLFIGYMGVYLCRKNLSTAVPLLVSDFHKTKSEIGQIASYGTLAYAFGKFAFGPLVDRWGGRTGFLASLTLVALFTALGGLAPGLGALTAIYAANRFCGAAGWGSMVRITPDLFPARLVGAAISVLCVSYVVGGASAAWLAGGIAKATGENWRAIMSLPAAILLALVALAWFAVPRRPAANATASKGATGGFAWSSLPQLLVTPAFLALCGLSFTTTLGREFFADWGVDFMKNVCHLPLANASWASSAFDLGGVAGILGVGWAYGRLTASRLRWVLVILFGLLTALMAVASQANLAGAVAAVAFLAAAGLLLYGPYSLLSGALAVDVRGKDYAATVAGMVDSAGYLAGATAGKGFGWLLDHGGYPRAFLVLASLMLLSAVLSLGISRKDAAAS